MSKNAVYQKPNYNNPSISIRQREKSMSISPHKTSTQQRRSFLPSAMKNEDLPSTEAKRYKENEEEYTEHIPRSIHQERTNKKSTYHNPPINQSSTGYSNNVVYQATTTSNKVELLKEQNLYLSQENAHLNELILEKNKIISTLEKKLDYQIQQEVSTLEQIEREKNKFLNEFHARDDQQRIEIERLLIELEQSNQEISRLNLEIQENLIERDREITMLRANFTDQNRHLIDNVISKKDHEIKTLEVKFHELQGLLDQMTVELRTEKDSAKMTESHLNQQLNRVLLQLEQVDHHKKIQISEQKVAYDNIILTMNKEKEQQISNVIFKYEVELKKYKNQLNEQILAKSNLENIIETTKLQHTDEVQKRLNEETQLKHHMHEMKLFYQQKQHDEMEKQKKLNFQETQMLIKAMELKNQEYDEDLRKLTHVNKQNKAEIQRLYAEIEKLRAEKKEEVERIEKINIELKQRISELTQANQEQSEALKVKLGQLLHSDISTLKQFYENELALKQQEIIDLEKVVKQNREKLHKELEEKVVQRKHHEKEIDELRIKIGELELKIAQIVEENKEKINTMGSQMQMTSLTLIQQTAQKQKYSKQTVTERKNLQEIITKKDEEIEELNSKLVLIKKSHIEEITEKQQTITILHQKSEQLNDEIRREREFYQKEISKKEQAKKQTKEFYELEIQKEKQTYSREFTEVTERLMKQKNQLAIQIEHLILIEKQLREELSLHSQHHEQRSLQKEVAYNEQKARLEYAKESAQIYIKNYYEKKLNDVQEELNATKQQLAEKAQDIRSLSEKNYKLEKKLEKLVENQEKMRVLEERVLAIGQENNIVKNIAQMVSSKSRRKAI